MTATPFASATRTEERQDETGKAGPEKEERRKGWKN
jgi:hypothetical protein